MAIINRTRNINKTGMKLGKNTFGTLHSGNGEESGGSGFGKLVFGVVASNGYNTKDMTFDEAYKIFKELGGKNNWAMSKFEDDDKNNDNANNENDAEVSQANEEEQRKQKIKEKRENAKQTISSKLKKGFTENQKNSILEMVDKIPDEDVDALIGGVNSVASIERLMGMGASYCMGSNIVVGMSAYKIDKELGFDFGASAFTHETGHALDHKIGISSSDEVVESAKQGYYEMLDLLAEKGGGKALKNKERITREEKQSVYKGIREIENELTGIENIGYKSLSDMGYKEKPHLSEMVSMTKQEYGNKKINERTRDLVSWGYSFNEARERAEKQRADYENNWQWNKDRYDKALKEYNEYEANGKNAEIKKQYEERNKKWEEYNNANGLARNKMEMLTDFLQIASNGKFELPGYYVHSKNYTKGLFGGNNAFSKYGRSCQSEGWAEYYQARVMGSKEQLDLIRKYVPSLAKKFDEIYDNINKGD